MTKRKLTRRYKKLKQNFRTQCQHENKPCWICGQPINYQAPPNDPNSFNLDHLLPVSTHPQHQHDPNNFRPSHRQCNTSRGNKQPIILGSTSRQW